jgi:hypothetical protein
MRRTEGIRPDHRRSELSTQFHPPQLRYAHTRTNRHDRGLAVIIGLEPQMSRSGGAVILDAERGELLKGGAMAKRHSRPSGQYRYEHYDPTP